MSTTDLKQDMTTDEVPKTETIDEPQVVEPKPNAQAGGALAFSELKGGKKSRRNQRSQKRSQKRNNKRGGSKKNKRGSSKRHQRGGR